MCFIVFTIYANMERFPSSDEPFFPFILVLAFFRCISSPSPILTVGYNQLSYVSVILNVKDRVLKQFLV